ncbi:DUF819 family protein [Anoxybacillus geothermalis]|nr:DUF819 family protein [Anoxybacillus geothermalis]
MTNTLIQSDDTWILWAILVGWAAISIYLEQKYQWAAKISGAIIALVGAMILANLNIIPTESPVYDTVWSYVIPLAIPLLLFQTNIMKIWRESGRLVVIFLISSVGTVAGAIISFFLLKDHIPLLYKISAMMTGSYIGGGVNFVAMAAKFETPSELVSATVVADNMVMALYFLGLILIPSLTFFRKYFKTPYIDELESNVKGDENHAASYWKRKDISLLDIAKAVGTTFVIVAISFTIAGFLDELIPSGEDANVFLNILNGILGDNYLMLTTITLLAVTLFPRYFENIHGTQEIGTFLIGSSPKVVLDYFRTRLLCTYKEKSVNQIFRTRRLKKIPRLSSTCCGDEPFNLYFLRRDRCTGFHSSHLTKCTAHLRIMCFDGDYQHDHFLRYWENL